MCVSQVMDSLIAQVRAHLVVAHARGQACACFRESAVGLIDLGVARLGGVTGVCDGSVCRECVSGVCDGSVGVCVGCLVGCLVAGGGRRSKGEHCQVSRPGGHRHCSPCLVIGRSVWRLSTFMHYTQPA